MERYALLRRRQRDWARAIQLWQKAAEYGHLAACIELSKYYEHRERNYTEALDWARKALDAIEYSGQNMYSVKAIERDIQRRIGRLYQKTYRAFGER
jgi:TPR repeat protein